MTQAKPRFTGHCLCGSVRFEVRGALTDVHACHCEMCRRQSGHFVVGASARRADFVLLGGGALIWYLSSPEAKRGFCSCCGSVMFWDGGGDTLGINAGALDQPTGLKLAKHIFVESKADYYEIDDTLPSFKGYREPA